MGADEFRCHIFSDTALKPKILQGACDLLSTIRHADETGHSDSLFAKTVKMFQTLAVYTQDFESKLLAESDRFFLSWAAEKSTALEYADYVLQCQDLIAREIQRCDQLGLSSSTRATFIAYIEDIVLEQRQEQLLNAESIFELLKNDAVEVLKQLYSLLQRRHLVEKLKQPFEAFIIKQGSGIVFDEEHEAEMVVRLLEFKKKLHLILQQSFQMHEGLGHSLRESFESFINKSKKSSMTWGTDNPKPGEMIAKHVDIILKGGLRSNRSNLTAPGISKKTSTEAHRDDSSEDESVEMTKQLDQVLDLFRFVHGKAVFEAFYKRDLARRLLLGRSASADAEKSMLTRLRSGMLVRHAVCRYVLM